MDEARMKQYLAQVQAYRASGMKASQWAAANGVPLRCLSSWCAHAARWQARLDGVPAPAREGRPAGFVAASMQAMASGSGASAGAAVRVELAAGAMTVSLQWPLSHARELAAWLLEVAR